MVLLLIVSSGPIAQGEAETSLSLTSRCRRPSGLSRVEALHLLCAVACPVRAARDGPQLFLSASCGLYKRFVAVEVVAFVLGPSLSWLVTEIALGKLGRLIPPVAVRTDGSAYPSRRRASACIR